MGKDRANRRTHSPLLQLRLNGVSNQLRFPKRIFASMYVSIGRSNSECPPGFLAWIQGDGERGICCDCVKFALALASIQPQLFGVVGWRTPRFPDVGPKA